MLKVAYRIILIRHEYLLHLLSGI